MRKHWALISVDNVYRARRDLIITYHKISETTCVPDSLASSISILASPNFSPSSRRLFSMSALNGGKRDARVAWKGRVCRDVNAYIG